MKLNVSGPAPLITLKHSSSSLLGFCIGESEWFRKDKKIVETCLSSLALDQEEVIDHGCVL